MKNLAISILNARDLHVFLDKLKNVEDKLRKNKIDDRYYNTIHFDVMDNKFVPNTGVNIELIKEVVKYGYYVDTHLMIENPVEEKYIDKAIEYGSRDITIHYEIDKFKESLDYLLDLKKKYNDLKIGISIKPGTDVKVVDNYITKIDKVLIMSVEPGFGGQKYIESVTDKIRYIKEKYSNIFVQVDGGVDENTISRPIEARADSFVVGSYLTRFEDELYDRITRLSIILDIHTLPKEANLEFESRTIQAVPGGYAQGDILLGIRVPRLRKLEKVWYNKTSMNTLNFFIKNEIHDYRRFAIFCIVRMVNKDNFIDIKKFIDSNLEHINNWDLVDSLAPIAIGKQMLELEYGDAKIYETLREYTKSEDIWTKRIGIVSLLYIAKENRKEVVFKVLDDVFYEEYHLFQKASGWVLRELYKVNPNDTLMYLVEKNNGEKIPRILKSYATEKMSIQEKNKLR